MTAENTTRLCERTFTPCTEGCPINSYCKKLKNPRPKPTPTHPTEIPELIINPNLNASSRLS